MLIGLRDLSLAATKGLLSQEETELARQLAQLVGDKAGDISSDDALTSRNFTGLAVAFCPSGTRTALKYVRVVASCRRPSWALCKDQSLQQKP